MNYLSKYTFVTKAGKDYCLFNLNNGALISVDKETKMRIDNFKNKLDINVFSEDEIKVLKDLKFIVDKEYDSSQAKVNEMTYSVAKFNNSKESLKIDFALTNKCNFCCPYCFEHDELNKHCDGFNDLLQSTAQKLLNYLNAKACYGVKYIEIVFYGGEPTIEKFFVVDFIKKIEKFTEEKDIVFKYVFVTNGFLFDDTLIKKLNPKNCKFVQITLDGEKDFHNKRRTNKDKINTFDTIVKNINLLCEHQFNTVIRLNVDKSNYDSVENLLKNISKVIDKKYFGKYLTVDIARVFGSNDSYDLFHYEDYRKKLVEIATKQKLITHRLGCKSLTTFCIAEGLTNDLVVDFSGNLYRCWNNVFDKKYKIWNLDDLEKKNYDPFETSDITKEYVCDLSLSNVNNGKCFSCEFCKYCQGLCPNVRKQILEGCERNIYKNNECKKIIAKRLNQSIRWVMKDDKNRQT